MTALLSKVCFITLLAVWPLISQGRVLSYSEPAWALTLKAHGAWLGAGGSAYGLDLPEDFSWDGSMNSSWGLEPGIIFHSGKVSFHAGFLYLTPMGQKDIVGTAKADALKKATLNLKHDLFVPQAHVEVDLMQRSESRIYLGVGAGWATLKARHSYDLSADLASDWPGFNGVQKLESQALSKSAFLGAERWLGKNSALAIEVGYRDLYFRDVTYAEDTALPGGTRSKGDSLRNGGHKVGFNHGGAFASFVLKTFIGR